MASQRCSMCHFFCEDIKTLFTHLVRKHQNASLFIAHCNVPGCGATYNKFSSFRKHVQRNHPNVITNANRHEELLPALGVDVNDGNASIDGLEMAEGAFVLKLKAAHNLSDVAVNEVLSSVREISRVRMDSIRTCLQANNVEITNDIVHALNVDSMYTKLKTKHHRAAFFQARMGLICPKAVMLGERFAMRKVRGKMRMKKIPVFGYYVPFLQCVQRLLSMPEIAELLENKEFGVKQDVQDGVYIQSHEYFKLHPDALLFSLYCDDFEIANPIGTHRVVHKLVVYYFQLLNIPPMYRSRLSSIQLVAVAKTNDVKKFGHEKLMQNFVSDLLKLRAGVRWRQQVCYGMLVYVTADTLAAQAIGGFKEGVGSAKKPCRVCEISSDEIAIYHRENLVRLRDELEHRDRCDILANLSKQAQIYWSKEYGVVKRTFLHDIPGFAITRCIVNDPMHVLLEGIDKVEVALLLRYLIKEAKLFDFDTLNAAIRNYAYSDHEAGDKPQEIRAQELEGVCLRQTAASMKVLMFTLPYLIGKFIPRDNQHWLNFILLLQINILCFSTVVSQRSCNVLEELIYQHNKAFVSLYPDQTFIPKLHYLIHFPSQMKLFGPLRNMWCMRLEGKHAVFKNKKWRNFINLPLSVAEYHQQWMCLHQTGPDGLPSTIYLYEGDKVKEGYTVTMENLPHFDILQFEDQGFDRLTPVLVTSEVILSGHNYRKGTVLLLQWDNMDEPVLCSIESIIVIEHAKYFICSKLNIVCFETNLNSFEVLATNEFLLVRPGDLVYVWPQRLHEKYVMVHHADNVWIL